VYRGRLDMQILSHKTVISGKSQKAIRIIGHPYPAIFHWCLSTSTRSVNVVCIVHPEHHVGILHNFQIGSRHFDLYPATHDALDRAHGDHGGVGDVGEVEDAVDGLVVKPSLDGGITLLSGVARLACYRSSISPGNNRYCIFVTIRNL